MKIGNHVFDFNKQGYIMGILNVTPDSFSDGNQYLDIDKAVARAKKMVEEGATIIDVGGESTRPNHNEVHCEEEIQRVVPVIKELVKVLTVPISIDTSKAEVAKEAILAGASMINDVWGFMKDSQMAHVAAKYNVPCCLMHNRKDPSYDNLMEELIKDLQESVKIAMDAGVPRENIMIDPGIGFAKTYEENLHVMRHLHLLGTLELPILLGTSRKSMIGFALDLPVEERVEGTLATTVAGYLKGCRIFRVHDVRENKRALDMTMKII